MSRAIHKVGRGGLKPVSIAATYTTDSDSTIGTASRSHPAFNVGSAYGKKFVLGILTMEDNAAGLGITTFQLGGVTLSQIVNQAQNDGSQYVRAYIFGANISSLSGSQSWTLTANQGINVSCIDAIVVHDLVSLTAKASNTDTTSTSSGLQMPVTGVTNGITIAGGGHVLRTVTASWATLTERSDLATGGGTSDIRHTAAWDIGAVNVAATSPTWSSSGYSAGCSAVFR